MILGRKKTVPNRHLQPKEAFHLSELLRAQLEAYVDATRPRADKSEALRLALKDFLASFCLWDDAKETQESAGAARSWSEQERKDRCGDKKKS